MIAASHYLLPPLFSSLLIDFQVALRNIRRDALKAYEKLEKVLITGLSALSIHLSVSILVF